MERHAYKEQRDKNSSEETEVLRSVISLFLLCEKLLRLDGKALRLL